MFASVYTRLSNSQGVLTRHLPPLYGTYDCVVMTYATSVFEWLNRAAEYSQSVPQCHRAHYYHWFEHGRGILALLHISTLMSN